MRKRFQNPGRFAGATRLFAFGLNFNVEYLVKVGTGCDVQIYIILYAF